MFAIATIVKLHSYIIIVFNKYCQFTLKFYMFLYSLPTKVARRFLEDGTKVRVSKKTGQIIPKPDPLFDRKMRSNGKNNND